MKTIEIEVLFKKIQKDDKKEVLEFHILGSEIPYKNELVSMAGGMAILQVAGCQELPAEFKSVQRDSKKATLKFHVKGNYTDRIIEMYKRVGGHVNLFMSESQLSIDDVYEEPHDGIGYGLDTSGVVQVAAGQLTINEIEDVPGVVEAPEKAEVDIEASEAEEDGPAFMADDVKLEGSDNEEIEEDDILL